MSGTIVEPKPGSDVGRVVVTVVVENIEDGDHADRGEISKDQIRRLSVEALVDSGATFFCLPKSVVEQLGLKFHRMRETRTIAGSMTLEIFRGASIDVQGRACTVEVMALPVLPSYRLPAPGRACTVEVMALPEGRQPLLGQIPLETLDWWVDTANRRLVGNPEHGGQWMAEVF